MPDWAALLSRSADLFSHTAKSLLAASGRGISAGAKLAKKRYDDTRPTADMEEEIDRQSTRAVLTRIDEIMKAQIDAFIARSGSGGDFPQKIEKAMKLKEVWAEQVKRIKDKDIRTQAAEAFKAELRTIFYKDPRSS